MANQFLKVEIAKIRKSVTLLEKMIEKWVSDKLPSSRFVHRDPSGPPESIFGVEKLQDGLSDVKTGPRNHQNRVRKSRVSAPTKFIVL